MIDSFLSLGSNMGNRYRNISKAISLIKSSNHISFISESKVYESKAMYNTKLENFYNKVVKVETTLIASDLLKFLKNIEIKMGRAWSVHRYSPRPIDIDILSYGEEIIFSKDLTIPHPQIKERKFVLKPWADIDSNYVLAATNKKISDLLMETKDESQLQIVNK